MNAFTITAAVILIAIGFAHSYLGERYILIRLFRRSTLPPLFGGETFTRRTLRFAWHLTTIAWWGFAALLLAPDVVLYVVSATFGASAAVTLVASRGRHFAWIAFLAVAMLAWVAAR